jgi:hypothetical protein
MRIIVIVALLSISFYSNSQADQKLLTPKDFKAYLIKPGLDSITLEEFLKCDSLLVMPSFLTVKSYNIHCFGICINGGPFFKDMPHNKIVTYTKELIKRKLILNGQSSLLLIFDMIKAKFKNGGETTVEPYIVKIVR